MADQGMAYCANRPLQDVFYIGETASHDYTAAEAATFRQQLTTANSYGAVYFPWVKALDPTGASAGPIEWSTSVTSTASRGLPSSSFT